MRSGFRAPCVSGASSSFSCEHPLVKREDTPLTQGARTAAAAKPAQAWRDGARLDGPVPGRIFAETLHDSPAEIPASKLPQTTLESELAFQVGEVRMRLVE